MPPGFPEQPSSETESVADFLDLKGSVDAKKKYSKKFARKAIKKKFQKRRPVNQPLKSYL